MHVNSPSTQKVQMFLVLADSREISASLQRGELQRLAQIFNRYRQDKTSFEWLKILQGYFGVSSLFTVTLKWFCFRVLPYPTQPHTQHRQTDRHWGGTIKTSFSQASARDRIFFPQLMNICIYFTEMYTWRHDSRCAFVCSSFIQIKYHVLIVFV